MTDAPTAGSRASYPLGCIAGKDRKPTTAADFRTIQGGLQSAPKRSLMARNGNREKCPQAGVSTIGRCRH